MPRPPRPLLLAALLLVLRPVATSTAVEPPPPGVARYVPREGLVLYTEFFGLDAFPATWSKTSASKILRETSTGVMLQGLAAQVLDRQFTSASGARLPGSDRLAILQYVAKNGGIAAGHARPGEKSPLSFTLIIPGAWKPATRELFDRWLATLRPVGVKPEPVLKPGGRSVAPLPFSEGGAASWWAEKGEDLIVTDVPDALIAAIDGAGPSAVDHPIRVELIRPDGDFQAFGVAFADIAHLPKLPRAGAVAAKLRLQGATRVDYRWGTQGPALQDEVRIFAPRPRAGSLAVLDQPQFDRSTLPPLPAGTVGMTTLSFRPQSVYDQIRVLFGSDNPAFEARFRSLEAGVAERFRLRLREDILAHLGPRMTIFDTPARKSSFTLLPKFGFQVPRTTIYIEMDDPKAVAKLLDAAMPIANAAIRARLAPAKPADGKPEAAAVMFRQSAREPITWTLDLPPQFAVLTNLRLTIVLGRKFLVVATLPELTRDALTAENRPEIAPNSDLARAIADLPGNLVALNVNDPRDTMPDSLAKVPMTLRAVLTEATPPPPPPAPPLPAGLRGPVNDPAAGAQPVAPPMVEPIQIDPATIPRPEAIRPFLFPGTLAIVVEDDMIRILSRTAFPDLAGSLEGSAQLRALPNLFKNGLPNFAPPAGPPQPPALPGRNIPAGRPVD